MAHLGAGHRKRLRERFLKSGLNGFLDYEIVELLLTLGTPRQDCKQRAKDTIKKFGRLGAVLDAQPDELQEIPGIGPANIFGLKLFQEVSEKYARQKIPKKISLSSPEAVVKYLREKIGREKKEHFLVLALDTRNNLISVNEISVGTLNASLVHPREVFEAAIKSHAAAVILAHNHPSGSLEPSDADIHITKQLVEAGKVLDIHVLDHVVVTPLGHSSFKRERLIS